MQLMYENNTNVDIKEKMSTLEEIPFEKHISNGDIQQLDEDVSIGDKADITNHDTDTKTSNEQAVEEVMSNDSPRIEENEKNITEDGKNTEEQESVTDECLENDCDEQKAALPENGAVNTDFTTADASVEENNEAENTEKLAESHNDSVIEKQNYSEEIVEIKQENSIDSSTDADAIEENDGINTIRESNEKYYQGDSVHVGASEESNLINTICETKEKDSAIDKNNLPKIDQEDLNKPFENVELNVNEQSVSIKTELHSDDMDIQSDSINKSDKVILSSDDSDKAENIANNDVHRNDRVKTEPEDITEIYEEGINGLSEASPRNFKVESIEGDVNTESDSTNTDTGNQDLDKCSVTMESNTGMTENENIVQLDTLIKTEEDSSEPMDCDENVKKDFDGQKEKNINLEKAADVKCNKVNEEENEKMDCTDLTEENRSQNMVQSVPENDESRAINTSVDEGKNNNALFDSGNDIVDLDEVKEVSDAITQETSKTGDQSDDAVVNKRLENQAPAVSRLSNTLDILSDDDDEPRKKEEPQKRVVKESTTSLGKCINIEDDDDIMLIEDSNVNKDKRVVAFDAGSEFDKLVGAHTDNVDSSQQCETVKEPTSVPVEEKDNQDIEIEAKKTITTKPENVDQVTTQEKKVEKPKPLVPHDFFKSYRRNLADMTRNDIEEFCLTKIVEGIIDRSNLNEMKTKLKTLAQSVDDHKKKVMMLTKQNRDLQLVLKSVQEEQKKVKDAPIAPLKITRSVGMQVLMTDKNTRRKNNQQQNSNAVASNTNSRSPKIAPNQKSQKSANTQQNIPVPRLVPAQNNTKANVPQTSTVSNTGKAGNSLPNGVRNSPPVQKVAEKRPHNRQQSVTVDLTDDEPPAKQLATRTSPAPPVRLVPSQNLLAPRQGTSVNSPRKVYIPISGPQANIRPQAIMLKSPPTPVPRQRGPAPMVRIPSQNTVRMPRSQVGRHPAPLPDSLKQYQPPNWKALPPAPDLKLSKVENGIVISWKIEGYQEDSYEEIASYQLYAYQETSQPPNTSLWKKIGDVKALPLPMACTLTQFMAGYKYYFAVRAVDVKSRVGPFSLPGSILLLNKM